jgi:hypothetical protein
MLDSGHPAKTQLPVTPGWRSLPRTRLGWWSAALTGTFIVLFLINAFVFMPASGDQPWRHLLLPFYGIAMLACGLAGGITGLLALTRRHERSWLVWLSQLPALWVVMMLLGEFLFPH